MGTTQLREELHKFIDRADDRMLQLVKDLIETDPDQYLIPGGPMDEATLKRRVKAAKSRINSGEYTTQEDLEREMDGW